MLFHLAAVLQAFLLTTMIFTVSWFLAIRSSQDREKMSSFECGFEPYSSARLPFSLKFFLLAVLFLIFDVEIVLLLATPPILYSTSAPMALGLLSFLFILLVGLIHEWHEGALDWT